MTESLYDLYQERVGSNLKDIDAVCDEIALNCKNLIKHGIRLPYKFTVKDLHEGDTTLLNPTLRVKKGIVATHCKPYLYNNSLHIDITVSNFVKVNEVPDEIIESNIRHKRWWELK